MEQNIKYEILNIILSQPIHLREIAKKLKINHMTISREIKKLYEENILDYRKEGKNKVYFLKKNLESKNYLFALENYKLLVFLKKYPSLKGIIEKIQINKKIALAILFGSYAKGIANKESDIDLYIETGSKQIKKDVSLIDTRLNVKIGKYDENNLLIQEINKNHIVLKGVEKYYEKNKLFN